MRGRLLMLAFGIKPAKQQYLGQHPVSLLVMLIRVLTERQYLDNERDRREAALLQREAISRDVHDLLGHSLTVLTLKAEVARRLRRLNPRPLPKN